MSINNSFRMLHLILVLSTLSISTQAREVNSFNLLLPTSYHPSKGRARQIVITSGGCYDWQSTENSVIRVKGTHHGLVPSQTANVNANCNSNGIVELAHEGQYPSSVFVVARGKSNTDLISIPVRIRDLTRISIFTKSRIMDIKEVQNLEVYGFDSENNTFTSLEGLRFKWTITQVADQKQSVGSIQKIPLSDSSLYMPFDTRKRLEQDEKVESDLLIVKALRVGKVQVQVKCLEPNYELITDEITLYIQEKFTIWPEMPINLLAGATYQYELRTLSGFNISVPSPNYRIETTNSFFQVDNKLLVTAPRRDATTLLRVGDVRTEPPYFRQVEVVAYQPDHIEVLLPEQLIIGKEVNYQLRFYNKKRQLMGSVDPILLNVEITEDDPAQNAFIIDRLSQKIEGYRKGSGTFRVEYNGQVVERRITTATPLKLVGSGRKLVFPTGQLYQLYVVGGSGSYKFGYGPDSEEDTLLTVSSNGLISTRKEGTATIQVADEKNPNNGLDIKVVIIKMGSIESIEAYKEFNLLEEGSLYLTARPLTSGQSPLANQYYTECNDVLLRGVTFVPSSGSASPLQVINSYPINLQTLGELNSLAGSNRHVEKMLRLRSSFIKEELWKEYELYLKYNEIKKYDLERILDDMEDYGICAKVVVKPISVFDGDVTIKRAAKDLDAASPALHLRVYDRLQTNLLGLPPGKDNQIAVTPLGSFKWKTSGGSYRWNEPGMEEVEVYINGIKLDGPKGKDREAYLYPTIKCPGSERASQTYTLCYRNPASSSLLRPVQQEIKLSLECILPNKIQLGLPITRQQPRGGQWSPRSADPTLRYLLSNSSNSTVYIQAGQCFRISLEPLVVEQGVDPTHFYNASNVKYELLGHKYGKIEEMVSPAYPSNDTPWNTRVYLYDTKNRKSADKEKEDLVTIVSREVTGDGNKVLYPQEIRHSIRVKTVKPITLAGLNAADVIEIPSLPNSELVLRLDGIEESDRFSVRCDPEVVTCTRNGNNEIVVSPKSTDKATRSFIKIVDDYTIGQPEISIPIRVSPLAGIDLWVSRTGILERVQRKQQIVREDLQTSTRVFDGDEFVAIVDVYTTNETSSGRLTKQPMKKIDPKLIELDLGEIAGQQVTELSRMFDPLSRLVFIVFKLQKVGSKESRQSQKLFATKLTAAIKYRINVPLVSNSAQVQVFNSISLKGASGSLPFEQLEVSGGKTTFARQVDAYAHVMESCTTLLEIQGGPPEIRTAIIGNPGEGEYFNVIKLSERRYRVETLKTTVDKKSKLGEHDIENIRIFGKEKNLLAIQMYLEEENGRKIREEIGKVRVLILVAPIRNIHISGNNQLLTGKQVRYLVEFGKEEEGQRIIKEECSLKYKWSVSPLGSRPLLQLTSDATKLGVNVTSVEIESADDAPRVVNSPSADLTVVVFSKKGREIGRSTKKVSVLVEEKVQLLSPGNPNFEKNNDVNIDSDELILIPPNSALRLGIGTVIEETSPCDKAEERLTISGDNLVVTGEAQDSPQLVKLSYRASATGRGGAVMPTYASILVTQICTAVIKNVDGGLAINPSAGNGDSPNYDNLQLVGFELMDCLGRKFLHYRFKGIEYRVSVTDPNVVSASILNVDDGLMSLEGHLIGHAQLTLEVVQNGVVKARDVVPVYVNVFIRPSVPISVHVGDIVNFKAPDNIGSDMKWSSSDNGVVKINSRTGEAVATKEGEAYIKLGAMSTRVSVTRVVDLVRKPGSGQNGYEYEVVYSGNRHSELEEDASLVKDQLSWKCQVLGKEGQFLMAIAFKYNSNGKQYLRCRISKIPNTKTIQTPVKALTLRAGVENKNIGFSFSKEFQETLQTFVILSERYINPKDPKFRKDKGHYLIVVQTSERLDVRQTGGKDSWILSNEFNGARQTISVDLSHYRSGEWIISLYNQRTKQSDMILISSVSPSETPGDKKDETVYDDVPKQGWKWTDILVIFMAVNFLAILGYQVWQSNSGVHSKSC